MMDKELVKFWNKFLRIEENDNGYRWWYDKGGNLVCAGYDVTPEITLDNLFKYAVPILWICNIELLDGIFWSVKASTPDVHGFGKHGDGSALDEDLTQALYQAIKQVLKES
jgi:hypothetical protein